MPSSMHTQKGYHVPLLIVGLISVAAVHASAPVSIYSFCEHLTANISNHHKHELRDLFQKFQLHRRRWSELSRVSDKQKQHSTVQNKTALPLPEREWLDEEVPPEIVLAARDIAKNHTETAERLIQEILDQLFKNGTTTEKLSIAHAGCFVHHLNPDIFPGRPVVSFMVEYYKRPWVIRPYVERLQKLCANTACELIVNVDSYTEAQEWVQIANETRGFVIPIFSNNIHETRGYNRAAGVARGQFVVICQDDDLWPMDPKFLDQKLQIFAKYPKVASIGSKGFRWCQSGGNRGEVVFEDPELKMPMEFVHVVDFAPVFVRRSVFLHVGGLDEDMTEPGMCAMWVDWDLSARLWTAGWQVVYQHSGMVGDGHPGNTHQNSLSGSKCWGRQQQLSSGFFGTRWSAPGFMPNLCEHVRRLNLKYLNYTGPHDGCPWKDVGCGALTPEEASSVTIY